MSNAPAGPPSPVAGPSFSFGFNLGKIPDHGEDSDPILRDGPDLGLIGVFDGMGGAGGTVYETADGPRSGAYLASRVARDVVEKRMLDLLEPDWNLNGDAAAEDLRRSVQTALQERLTELKAPASRLRSKLLRALPTTMAVVALQRTHRDSSRWTCHIFWAGDSRAYAVDAGGLRQLSTDDLRDDSDAMANLHRDSVVSNAMSADTDFKVNYRRVELDAPFMLAAATDGCFGYLPSPMHFERLLLSSLAASRSDAEWSNILQDEIKAVTGDDASMAVIGVGADLSTIRTTLKPRLSELQDDFIAQLDAATAAVADAERRLEESRLRQTEIAASRWNAYKPGYEEHLHPAPPSADDEPVVTAEETATSPAAADETESVESDRAVAPIDTENGDDEGARQAEPGAENEAGVWR